MLLLARHLNILVLGETEAKAVGMPVVKFRMGLLFVAAMTTATSVCVSGNIGFVGLVIPHMTRRLVGSDYRFLMPASMLGGGLFLLLVDNVSRSLTGIPIGILTSFIGAPFFLWMITGRRDHYEH